ncbi:hypothetical protein U1Q18_002380 [Sarracenia purpurea var. burkii]
MEKMEESTPQMEESTREMEESTLEMEESILEMEESTLEMEESTHAKSNYTLKKEKPPKLQPKQKARQSSHRLVETLQRYRKHKSEDTGLAASRASTGTL